MQASSPFATAHQDWLAMAEALREAEDSRRQAETLSVKIMAENEVLQNQLHEAKTDLKFWMAYAVRIETRLDVIQEVIGEAREEAKRLAEANTEIVQRTTPEPAQEPPRRTIREIMAAQDDGAAGVVRGITDIAHRWP
jgi:hypothetical protein